MAAARAAKKAAPWMPESENWANEHSRNHHAEEEKTCKEAQVRERTM
jgi:hypothetical protein